MADHPVTFFEQEDSPDDTDLLYLLADPAGTPADKKLQWVTVRNQASASGGLPSGGSANKVLWYTSSPNWEPVDYLELNNVASITITQDGVADIDGFSLNLNWDNLTGDDVPEALYLLQYTVNGGEFWHLLGEQVVTADGSTIDYTLHFQPADTIKVRIRTADATESNYSEWLESNSVTVV